MRFRDLTGMALSNLWRQKMRSFLTIVGVCIGVGALVLMVSLGIGIKRAILKQMDSTNLLTEIAVLPMKIDLQAMLQRRRVDKLNPPKKIDKEVMESLRTLEGVRAVYPNYSFFVHWVSGEQSGGGELYGIPPEGVTESLTDAKVAGRVFTEGAKELIISDDMARERGLGEPEAVVGKKLKFTTGAQPQQHRQPRKLVAPEGSNENFEFEIVGVFSAGKYKSLSPRIYTSLTAMDAVRRCAVSAETLKENPNVLDEVPMLTVRVKDFTYLDAVTQEIENRGYGTLTIKDLIEMVENVFQVVEALLGCIGGVGLLVSFFGIANTMLMAILERTREIGIMKAVGGTKWNIATIFLFEASGIGVLGGGLGIGAGWLMGVIGNWLATLYAQSQGMTRTLAPFDVSIWLAGGAMVFSIGVSIVAGLYPAWRAARLDPVVALRHD